MEIYPHWDWLSMILYIIMGIIGAMAVRNVNRKNGACRCSFHKGSFYSYVTWGIIWVVFASFRYVTSQIGGMDASAYIQYFHVCLKPGDYWYAEHVDALYRLINKGIRLFTDDHHILFIVIYSFIFISYIQFIEEFRFSKMSYIPFVLLVYIYIRGFCTIRTNLGVGCILISMVFLRRGKKIRALLFACVSVLFQVASFVYAGFLVFYYMYKKRGMKISKCVFWILCAAAIGKFGQYVIANYNIPLLSHGAYRWYAVYSQAGQTFFTNFWKISFSQILLGVTMAALWRPLNRDIKSRSPEERERLEFLKLICMYDIILIPVTYILNIWRGYEYLYIARLVMWAELIPLACKKMTANSRTKIKLAIAAGFIGWMIFRQYNTWEDSGLMPYVFEPLMRAF